MKSISKNGASWSKPDCTASTAALAHAAFSEGGRLAKAGPEGLARGGPGLLSQIIHSHGDHS